MSFWDRTKTNRLKLPAALAQNAGIPLASEGQFVHAGSGVSAGTVGKIIAVSMLFGEKAITVEMLDGTQHDGGASAVIVIPYEAIVEVKAFYEDRPHRIKVAW